jgi:hypothetical protein
MAWSTNSAWRRVAAVWVALSLVAIAGAMLAYALDQRATADFLRSLALPGQQPPNTATFDVTSQGAIMEAVIALALGAAAWFFSGRPFFAISAIWAVLAVGTGVWSALDPTPRLGLVEVGPFNLSMVFVGLALALAAVSCLAGSAVGWLASPSWPGPLRPHMPPPTHQG